MISLARGLPASIPGEIFWWDGIAPGSGNQMAEKKLP